MKLDKLYKDVADKVVCNISEQNLIAYIYNVKAKGNYKDLTVRIANDVKHATFKPDIICEWYDEYNCNDNHITTLFKKVIKENYPNAWKVIQEEN
jgi:hypothetical protein